MGGENLLNDNSTLHLHSPCTAAFSDEGLDPLQITDVYVYVVFFFSKLDFSVSSQPARRGVDDYIYSIQGRVWQSYGRLNMQQWKSRD